MKTERSNVKFPLWRKKVDNSLFTKLDTPIPNWLSIVWCIEPTFGTSSSKRSKESEVTLIIQNKRFKGSVLFTKFHGKDTNYKLFFTKDFADELKDLFVMSYMRTLESKLRRGNENYTTNIEDDIPFWEFLDIEFDKQNKTFFCKAHYTQKALFPELFKQLTNSHLLRDMENRLLEKGDFKFIKEDWKAKSELSKLLEHKNIIYYLIDVNNKLLYIGESESTKRIRIPRNEIPGWTHFRIDCLPEWIAKSQRVELERLAIRTFASVMTNHKNIMNISISEYSLANKKIDS
jgi:hypothetical protein